MRILLIGGSGLVGRALQRVAPPEWHITAPSHADCDITNETSVGAAFAEHRPNAVINCAAFTDVDGAELHEGAARRVNVSGAATLARACSATRTRFVHMSTDYVFDGQSSEPYAETAPTHAVSAYGRSKLDGEIAVSAACPEALIIRSQWIFGEGGRTLVNRMRDQARRGDAARATIDQRGRPTYARDLATMLVAVTADASRRGLLHIANEGDASPFEIAQHVYAHYSRAGDVTAVDGSAFPTPARRPPYSVLALERLKSYGIVPRHWRSAVTEFLNDADRASG